ncbi:MAG TPA: hypothetical protein VFF17_02275 [Thermoanaerobaculia bacterium]|nr:hypothetical protein [Thermoanaerobaculia bacterium]
MSVPFATRATVLALALTVAGVPIARRLCGLTCDATPSPAAARRTAATARPIPLGPARRRPNPTRTRAGTLTAETGHY